MDPSSTLIGFGIGALGASVVAWALLREHARRIRSAERRARRAERMAEIGAMTGGLAHEIKNPLSTIGLNAQLMVEGIQELDIPESDRSPLLSRTKALQRETDRLRGILQDFLDFAGEVRLDRRPADINQVVTELADFFAPEAERHGVSIRTELAPGPIQASIDVRAVKQALLNLMINATQAMSGDGAGQSGKRGVLTLGTAVDRDTDGSGGGKGRVVSIRVLDTGPGIAPDSQAQIFKPYFTTKSGGSGLGLPTSRRLIEEHGGQITVESQPAKGATFTVVLPLD